METGDKKRKIEKDRERKGREERARETEDLCNKAETQADGKQNAWNNDGITAREEKEMHITEQ